MFCWGEPGYSAIVRDFGRQPIQDWTVHRFVSGPAAHPEARSLTIATVPLPTRTAPSGCLDPITEEFLACSADTTVALVTAVDVRSWNAVLVELSSTEADQGAADVYEVLHVSSGA